MGKGLLNIFDNIFFTKKYSIIIVIGIITLLLLILSSILYGNETVYIADYMPGGNPNVTFYSDGTYVEGPSRSIKETPFEKVRLERLTKDILPIFFSWLILSIIYIVVVKVLKKKILQHKINIILLIIPIIILGVRLFFQYGYTC